MSCYELARTTRRVCLTMRSCEQLLDDIRHNAHFSELPTFLEITKIIYLQIVGQKLIYKYSTYLRNYWNILHTAPLFTNLTDSHKVWMGQKYGPFLPKSGQLGKMGLHKENGHFFPNYLYTILLCIYINLVKLYKTVVVLSDRWRVCPRVSSVRKLKTPKS